MGGLNQGPTGERSVFYWYTNDSPADKGRFNNYQENSNYCSNEYNSIASLNTSENTS